MSFSLSKSQRLHSRGQVSPSPRKSIHKIQNNDKLKVFIKFKPQKGKPNQSNSIIALNNKQIQIQNSLNKKVYTFDHVFQQNITSKEVFNIGCKDLIQDVIQGVTENKINNNGLVFVYGNTGTGKTHTMGLVNHIDHHSHGIIPDAFRYIFQQISSHTEVCLSFCQIYKDQVYDLLDFQQQKKLNIRQNQKSKQPYIEDLIMIQVLNFDQASQLINIGLEKRRIGQQKINKRSSRGHGYLAISIKSAQNLNSGKLSFIDLAGCQRIKQSQSKGSTLHQALHINASLSALQTLLMNISDQNVRSYRSNKLTRLLQPYFQYGKIRLFVTSNYQALQSIEFAKRCKGIKFMERQVRRDTQKFRTPRKDKTHQNQSSAIQKLKKQFNSREKTLLKCISTLSSIIQKLHQSSHSLIHSQSILSNFSLPNLFHQLGLQQKVNIKINTLQKRQQQILFDQNQMSKLSQISTNLSEDGDVNRKINDIIRNMQEIGFRTNKSIQQLAQLAQYKNVYKKQYFTTEVKNSLLQNKNAQFQKAISLLVEQVSKSLGQIPGGAQTQSKLFKKLKQFGILLAEQGQQNIKSSINKKSLQKSQVSNIKTPTKQINKKQSMAQSANDDEQCQSYFKSRKRSLIYIDQD